MKIILSLEPRVANVFIKSGGVWKLEGKDILVVWVLPSSGPAGQLASVETRKSQFWG